MVKMANNIARFCETSKRKEALSLNGYEYRFAKLVDDGDRKYWRCVKRNCSGSVKTNNDNTNVTVLNGNHSHISNPESTDVRVAVQAMRTRAENEVIPLPQIYKEGIGVFSGRPTVAAQMPSYLHLQASLHKRRRSQYPVLPRNRNGIVIPNNLAKTLDGRNFLLHAAPGNDFIIFATAGE
jgi:hypothetical protein